MKERIDHEAETLRLADLSQHPDIGDPAVGALHIGAAQVHATLALAEQQRIANLIAIYVTEGAAESGFIGKGFDFGYMADQIREGLGL